MRAQGALGLLGWFTKPHDAIASQWRFAQAFKKICHTWSAKRAAMQGMQKRKLLHLE